MSDHHYAPDPALDTWPAPPSRRDPATYADLYLQQLDQSLDLYRALIKAERFIAGFEDDPDQDGVPELLAEIRAAVDVAVSGRAALDRRSRRSRRAFNGPALLSALFAPLPFMAGVAGALLWIHAR